MQTEVINVYKFADENKESSFFPFFIYRTRYSQKNNVGRLRTMAFYGLQFFFGNSSHGNNAGLQWLFGVAPKTVH